MKLNWIIVCGVCVAGCMGNSSLQTEAIAYDNVYHLARLRKGMNESEVLSIMRRPFDYETFVLGEDVYDVWFYVTQGTILGQTRMVARNLTPLTFKNGILVGTGYDYYYYVTRENAKQIQAEKAPEQSEQAKKKEAEDIEFEKALKLPEHPKQAPDQVVPASSSNQSTNTALIQRVSAIQMGMTQAQVNRVMGNPDQSRSFQVESDIYDVWIYKGKAPLTFKNGVLVGQTREYYEGIRNRGTLKQVDQYDQQGERMQEDASDQDFNFW